MSTDTPTVREIIERAGAVLRAAGLPQPRREARLLIQHGLGLSTTEVIAGEDTRPSGEELAWFVEALRQRSRRVPLAHILTLVDFFGLSFAIDSRALIPRPDSEVLIEAALSRVSQADAALIDLGTGSGCLLLTLLVEKRGWTGLGTDVSSDALDLAQQNALVLNVDGRVRFVREPFAETDLSTADLVISNPPYIATDEIAWLEPEVRDHDPRLALDGGPDGLDAYRVIVPKARREMKVGAWLLLEVGHDQGEAVAALFEGLGFDDVMIELDYAGRDRVVCGCQTHNN